MNQPSSKDKCEIPRDWGASLKRTASQELINVVHERQLPLEAPIKHNAEHHSPMTQLPCLTLSPSHDTTGHPNILLLPASLTASALKEPEEAQCSEQKKWKPGEGGGGTQGLWLHSPFLLQVMSSKQAWMGRACAERLLTLWEFGGFDDYRINILTIRNFLWLSLPSDFSQPKCKQH